MHIDKEAYQEAVGESLEKMKDYKHYQRFIELAGNSHLSARNLCAVLGTNPEASEVGTLKYWNKRQFIIKAKEKGIKILMPSPDNPKEFVGGVVFDQKQITASEKAIQQGKKAYEHTYPYIGTKEGLKQFLEHFNKGIGEMRVDQSKAPIENSSRQGAMITIDSKLKPNQQAQAVLLEYARFVMGKNMASNGEINQSYFENEFKAVTMASIMGRRLGFSLEEPELLMNKPLKPFLLENTPFQLEKLLSDSVNKANKSLFQVSRAFFKSKEAQQEIKMTI